MHTSSPEGKERRDASWKLRRRGGEEGVEACPYVMQTASLEGRSDATPAGSCRKVRGGRGETTRGEGGARHRLEAAAKGWRGGSAA
eukprot:360851-Chlamydomonas_euryale.AAC.9